MIYFSKAWRQTLCTSLISLGLLSTPSWAAAPEFPKEKMLSLLVPYPAGGGSDVSARTLAGPIGQELGQTVVVENLAGATGAIAVRHMLQREADGYQFFHGSPSELIIPTMVNKAIKFTANDVELLHPLSRAPLVLLVKNDLPVQTLDEFLELAKDHSQRPLSYGSVGVGSMYHLVAERMAKELNLNVQHVPYRGGAPVIQDLAGGQIDFSVLPFQSNYTGLINEQRFRILAVFGDQVPDILKGIPSVTAHPLLKDFDYSVIAGHFVKRGTPLAVKEKLRQAIVYSMSQAKVREQMEFEGRIIYEPVDIEQADQIWQQEIKDYEKLVQASGIEPF